METKEEKTQQPETAPASVCDHFAGLPFGSMIGGPLNAAVTAQAQAAHAATDFIRQMRLDTEGVRRTEFTLPDGKPVHVPLLTILPVPYIMVEEAQVEFKIPITTPEQEGK